MLSAWSRHRQHRRRAQLAHAFATALDDVVRPAHAFSARAPVARAQVLAAHDELEQIVARLREDDGVDPAALLVAEDVLCDADGPLFVERPAGALRERLKLLRLALD